MKKYFYIYTFGCRVNQYESEVYKQKMESCGYIYDEKKADIIILNTCSVTKSADKTCMNKLKSLLTNNKDQKIYITGCFETALKKENIFKKNKNIFFISNLEKEKLIDKITKKNLVEGFVLQDAPSKTRAFLKIQDGCNNFCSYCIIPFVRGRSRSKSIETILKEASFLVEEKKFKEIVLTGINIGDYDFEGYTLYDVLKRLLEIKELKRIRLSSIDPNQVDEKLFNLILSEERICNFLHLSLQSGSDRILKKMNRNYRISEFLDLVNNIREKEPDFGFSTDIIIGFPGENEEDFQKSLDIIKHVQFTKVHFFPFSKRENTLAASFKNNLSPCDFKRRKEQIVEVSEKASKDFKMRFINKKLKVLIEKQEEQFSKGHSENFLSVKVKGKQIKNSFVNVKIIESIDGYLIGEVYGN